MYWPFSYCIDLSAIWTGWAIYQNLPTRSNRKRVLPWPKLSTNADVWDESQRKLSEIQLIWTSELLTNMRKIFLTYICNKTIKFTINDCVVIRYAVRMQFLNCENIAEFCNLTRNDICFVLFFVFCFSAWVSRIFNSVKSVTGVARFLNLWSLYDFLHRNKNNRKITNNHEAITCNYLSSRAPG